MNRTMTCRALAALAAICATAVGVLATGASGSGSVSIASPAGVTETFDGLSNSTSPSGLLPAGWYLSETGTGAAADGLYVVGIGSSNGGGAYSFGAAGSTERALGSLGSGTVTPIQYGAQFTNHTGAVISSVTITYTGEMWRRGTATATSGEGLTFAYSTDATALTSGTYIAVPALAFASPGDACSSRRTSRPMATAPIAGSSSRRRSPTSRFRTARLSGSAGRTSIPAGATMASLSMTSASRSARAPSRSTRRPPVRPRRTPSVRASDDAERHDHARPEPVVGDLRGFLQSHLDRRVRGAGRCRSPAPPSASTPRSNAGTPPNTYLLPCSVADDQSRSTTFTISLTVLIPLNSTCGATADAD